MEVAATYDYPDSADYFQRPPTVIEAVDKCNNARSLLRPGSRLLLAKLGGWLKW